VCYNPIMLDIPVVILAGGFGSRISEETSDKPKPLIEIGGTPIISHIIDIFAYQGFKNFIVCTGYKYSQLNEYFINFAVRQKKIEVNLNSGKFRNLDKTKKEINIKLVYTGHNSNTGHRIKLIKEYIKKGSKFLFTYGDGLADINLKKLFQSHKISKKIGTISVYNYNSKYGYISLKDKLVKSFDEKPKLKNNFINIGFGIFNYSIFDYIKDKDIFEIDTLQRLIKKEQLSAYLHEGKFNSMDSLRDKMKLEEIFMNDPYWVKNDII